MWIGSGATLAACSAINHTLKTFPVLSGATYVAFLTELTGLIRGNYELISISEFLRLVCFLIGTSSGLKDKLFFYLVDNMNVATWLKWRRPGPGWRNIPPRFLNRLECEYNSQIAPVYISTRNNQLRDEFPILSAPEAVALGISKGYTSADVEAVA